MTEAKGLSPENVALVERHVPSALRIFFTGVRVAAATEVLINAARAEEREKAEAREAQIDQAVACMRIALTESDVSTVHAIIKAALDFATNDEEALAEGRALAPAPADGVADV
jgi:galactokinase/mevalonate kinase-like predicted kinase